MHQDLLFSVTNRLKQNVITIIHVINLKIRCSRYKHNKSCIIYPCPECEETFSNVSGVYRHLIKAHSKTVAQIRRLRSQIHSSGVRKDQIVESKKCNLVEKDEGWIDFESYKDLQVKHKKKSFL